MTTQRFQSKVVRMRTKAYVPVPFDPNDVWPGKDRHYVRGTVGGHSIRGLLRLEGDDYSLPLGPAWLRDNLLPTAATIDVVLEPDGPQSEALAADITQAFNASPEAEMLFNRSRHSIERISSAGSIRRDDRRRARHALPRW